MHDLVREVFHGHLRSIIGGLTVEDLIANRNELAQQTREASSDEMQKLGLVVDSLQIQDIVDPTGYIRALGAPREAAVQMQARIAQAQSDREATEREQEAEALKAAAARDTAIKRAQFQAEMDKAAAMSAQSGPLADAEARKNVVVQETQVAELEALARGAPARDDRQEAGRRRRLPGAGRGRGQARGAHRPGGGGQEGGRAARRGRRQAHRAVGRGGREEGRADRARPGEAGARGRRGRGRRHARSRRGRGRRDAGQGAGRGGGDREARRGARAGVGRRHRASSWPTSSRKSCGRRRSRSRTSTT